MTGLMLALEGGGTAELTESDGAHVVIRSSTAAPPGATVSGNAAGIERPFRIKVRKCRRLEDGGEHPFRIEGRFVDVTREQRSKLPGPRPE
jgi:hypothetical protein